MLRSSALVLLLSGVLVAGCGGAADEQQALSAEEFEQRVEQSRERVESSLRDVSGARSPEDVAARLREAAEETRAVADELGEIQPPEEAEEGTDRLVAALRQLGDELDRTAERAEDEGPAALLEAVQGAGAETLAELQDALAELERQGFDVGRIEYP